MRYKFIILRKHYKNGFSFLHRTGRLNSPNWTRLPFYAFIFETKEDAEMRLSTIKQSDDFAYGVLDVTEDSRFVTVQHQEHQLDNRVIIPKPFPAFKTDNRKYKTIFEYRKAKRNGEF
jgi:hypothetical protein